MITPSIRPPSSAGIGRRLNKPKASEIIPMSIHHCDRAHSAMILCPTPTIPTGHESWEVASCFSTFDPDRRVEIRCPREENVKRVCWEISCSAMSGA